MATMANAKVTHIFLIKTMRFSCKGLTSFTDICFSCSTYIVTIRFKELKRNKQHVSSIMIVTQKYVRIPQWDYSCQFVCQENSFSPPNQGFYEHLIIKCKCTSITKITREKNLSAFGIFSLCSSPYFNYYIPHK